MFNLTSLTGLSNLGALPYKIIAIALIVIGTLVWHYYEIKIEVQAAESRIRLELTQQYNKKASELKDRSIKVQTELQDTVTKQQKEHNAQVNNLNLRLTALSNSLSDRPLRPSSDSSIPRDTQDGTSAKGATGAGLYQDDARFLGWYAGQAEELKVNLLMCYRQYDTVKDTLDKFKVDNTPK